jgi:putative FmdB family regulatory protein
MPLFDFHCQNCDKTSELLLRASDTAACPHCGSNALEKLLAMPAAPGKSKAIIASARAAANKEGHFSNFSAGERKKILKA